MATVIDEFVVQIGLDASKFTPQQKKLLDDFKKTQEAAVSGAKKVESATSAVGDAINSATRKALGLFSLMVGGYGLKEFLVNTTKVNAETGRTAQLLDTTTKALSTWRGVAQLSGGSAQGMTAAIGGLVSQFQNFALTGESSVIPYFRALDIQIADSSGKMRKFDDIMLDLADRFSKLDPAKARAFGQALGFDEGTISLLIRGRAAVAALADESRRLGVITQADADRSAELVKQWAAVEQAATSLGRKIVGDLTPSLSGFLQRVTLMFQAHREGKRYTPGYRPGGSDAEPSEVWSGPEQRSNLRTKAGAGDQSIAAAALAHSLQAEVPGLDRFTAFNDKYHSLLGRSSAHTRGQALDFTVKDASQSAAVAEAVRKKLAAMGVDGTVLDEYQSPSRGSTGGHIHVQFNSAAAAARYADVAAAGRGGTSTGGGNRTNSVNIGKLEITTQATDATGIAATIKPAIERSTLVTQAQAGPQ